MLEAMESEKAQIDHSFFTLKTNLIMGIIYLKQ